MIDLQKDFSQKKYIIRLYPDVSEHNDEDLVLKELIDLGGNLSQKNEMMLQKLTKIEEFEKSNRNMQTKVNKIYQLIDGIDKKLNPAVPAGAPSPVVESS